MILRRLGLASMRQQIFLLAVLPIFLLAAFAAIRASLRETDHVRVEWASYVAADIAVAAERVRAATSPGDLDVALRLTAEKGIVAEVTGQQVPDAIDLRVGRFDEPTYRDLIGRLIALTDRVEKDGMAETSNLAVRIDEDRALLLRPQPLAFPSRRDEVLWSLGITLLVVLPVLLLSYYLSHRLTRPLIDFAAAARRISLDEASQEPFSAEGALEIRSLGNSLNVMRARINRMIDQRTSLLRSVGHDLRTPLTRLRMRAERCTDIELQHSMLQDITTLAAMIDESMRYLNNKESGLEAPRRVDLSSLLHTIAADYADTNISVSVDGPRRLVCQCMPRALTRALCNLIDNASRYGTTIELVLTEDETGDIIIDVRDDGPGLSDDMKKRALEPFFKGDPARALGPRSGIGLGLPIANGIARTHGGTLHLLDRQPHGLIARLVLPPNLEAPVVRTSE
ncbi:ATP-binding protein [Ancylobacter sp. WKF20]|uniref:ATP-binding protein n=1 Tax=Ancylobacter sp. WKF20 TaxID=3039801 RepID=UPI00243415E3|nr:ATP-binding protein [Ancylobacter sp. WKF20]WGD32244.1 ATP-binding protein [Ancylobacter sp. WKF20]